MSQKSITIIGPTASGKSAMAVAIAKKLNGEIISADSRQIHRNLDIGTGKEPGKIITNNAQGKYTKTAYVSNGVPHYMIDIVHPNTEYNVQKFVKKAKNIRSDIWHRNNLPIIAGGTMFWAQALLEDATFPSVKPNKELRNNLKAKSSKELFKILQKKDSAYAKKVDKNNPVRLIRAIEIATELGSVPAQKNKKIDSSKHLIIAISHPREVLYNAIEKRMDKWFDEGIFEEIKHAHYELNVPWTRLESFGLEYKWCTRYVRGQISFDQMRDNTIRDLKNYAKRQETWIRRWERQGTKIHRVTKTSEAIKLCKNFLNN
ncbi:MAG: tRNA (adenosine(37)-N6)-dimethylallyltransferase MiaA [Patescibacteria group bacterium]